MAPRIAETSATQLLHDVAIVAPPIDLQRIAQHLKLVVAYEPLVNDVSGMLLRRNERAVVAVNASHPAQRHRFTIAHEIGHFKLHTGIYIDKDNLVLTLGLLVRALALIPTRFKPMPSRLNF